MFTLPVTVSQHIWSKVIVATVMSIIATVAAVLSIGIIGSGSGLLVGWAMCWPPYGNLLRATLIRCSILWRRSLGC